MQGSQPSTASPFKQDVFVYSASPGSESPSMGAAATPVIMSRSPTGGCGGVPWGGSSGIAAAARQGQQERPRDAAGACPGHGCGAGAVLPRGVCFPAKSEVASAVALFTPLPPDRHLQ